MKQIDELFSRRTEKILPSPQGLSELVEKRKITLYFGVDPTATRLHLGHTIGIRKLQEFADLGHKAILLFGTGTVLVGDPSLRAESRKPVTQEEIEHNISNWKDQVSSIVDFDKVTIQKNGDWLLKLTYKDIVGIASHISAVQLFKRESFQRRIERGDTVWYHETMYPLLQGYDSVAMNVDLEIGGTDQEFNMLIGRELLRKMKSKEKFILTTPMILGTDGKTMSKTSGNCVWLNDMPNEMFGKLMRVPDDQIIPYLTNATNMPMERVNELKKKLESGMNPMDAKKELATMVVSELHSATAAFEAKTRFEQMFQQGQTPSDIPLFDTSTLPADATIIDLLEKSSMVKSRGEAKRLIDQKGISVNQQQVTNDKLLVSELNKGDTLQIGKRKWIRIV